METQVSARTRARPADAGREPRGDRHRLASDCGHVSPAQPGRVGLQHRLQNGLIDRRTPANVVKDRRSLQASQPIGVEEKFGLLRSGENVDHVIGGPEKLLGGGESNGRNGFIAANGAAKVRFEVSG